VFSLTFLVVLLAAAFLPYVTVVRGATALASLASAAAYVWIQRRERTKLRHLVALVAREGATGYVVEATIYAIRDAVAVEESEDEGLSYYLLLDGRTLFLSGQYLYEAADNGFPWESFELVRVVHGRWVLRVVRRGAPVIPSRTRGPFSADDYRSGDVPSDGTIENRDFDELRTRPRMKGYRPARKRVTISVGESVRIIRELQELSQNELAELKPSGVIPECWCFPDGCCPLKRRHNHALEPSALTRSRARGSARTVRRTHWTRLGCRNGRPRRHPGGNHNVIPSTRSPPRCWCPCRDSRARPDGARRSHTTREAGCS
jgi:hypothetical protein